MFGCKTAECIYKYLFLLYHDKITVVRQMGIKPESM